MNGCPVGLLEPVDRRDVRVVERGEQVRLAPEAAEPLGVVRHLRRQHLDRDVAPERRVGGAVDLAHAAGADGRRDPVVRQCPSNQVCHLFLVPHSAHRPVGSVRTIQLRRRRLLPHARAQRFLQRWRAHYSGRGGALLWTDTQFGASERKSSALNGLPSSAFWRRAMKPFVWRTLGSTIAVAALGVAFVHAPTRVHQSAGRRTHPEGRRWRRRVPQVPGAAGRRAHERKDTGQKDTAQKNGKTGRRSGRHGHDAGAHRPGEQHERRAR